MDQAVMGPGRRETLRLPCCVFQRALLARCAVCELARARQRRDGEVIDCASPVAWTACKELSGLLREKAAFALKLTGPARLLPHAVAMRLQCGGLQGFQSVLDPAAPAPDVHRLVRLAIERHGELAALPFSQIVRGVAAWRGRRGSP
jgi:hypothetical protein